MGLGGLLALLCALPAARASERTHAHLTAALEGRRQHARDQWGGADLVVVVTWFNKSLDWLIEEIDKPPGPPFPLNFTRFVIYNKGGPKLCERDLPPALLPYVLSCENMHNAGGREAHSIPLFIVRHYHSLPRIMYFTHDDIRKAHMPRVAGLARLGYPVINASGFEQWAHEVELKPLASDRLCACEIEVEKGWERGGRYGPYEDMRWFMETFLELDVARGNWTTVRWAAAGTFAVPAVLVRKRSLVLYALLLQLFNGTSPWAEPGRCKPEGTVLCEQLVTEDTLLVYRKIPMLGMAHLFERLWFAVFDPSYTPNPEHWAAVLRRDTKDASHLKSLLW